MTYTDRQYTGQSWQDLPAETRADNADLFYWLHQSNFYGQSVLAAAYQALEETASAKITIKNLSACKKQYFLPYAADTAALADELPFRLRIATVSVEHKGEIQRFPIGRITVAIPVRQHRTRRSTHVMDVVQQRFNSGRKQLFPGETVKQPGGMHLPIQPE